MDKLNEQKIKKLKRVKKVGNYIIDYKKKLGKWAYGQIFLAINIQTKENFAAKIIDKATILHEDYSKYAILRQVQIIKRLKSINIIQFIQVVETTNNVYIIQQLADQGSLKDLLQKNWRFSQDIAIGYILQILNGFKQLIKHGVTHRDIKPMNILIKDNKLKITDFSLACYSASPDMKQIAGTPVYMAPQALQRQKYTHKCDIWSLGVMFYELVVGRIPWIIQTNSTKDLLSFIRQRAQNKIQFPEKLQISQAYKDLVRGCLKINEQQRFDWPQIFNHKLFEEKI